MDRMDARGDSDMTKAAWAKIIQDSHDKRAEEDQIHNDELKKSYSDAIQEWKGFAAGNELKTNKHVDAYDAFKGRKLKVIVKVSTPRRLLPS